MPNESHLAMGEKDVATQVSSMGFGFSPTAAGPHINPLLADRFFL